MKFSFQHKGFYKLASPFWVIYMMCVSNDCETYDFRKFLQHPHSKDLQKLFHKFAQSSAEAIATLIPFWLPRNLASRPNTCLSLLLWKTWILIFVFRRCDSLYFIFHQQQDSQCGCKTITCWQSNVKSTAATSKTKS